MIKTVLAIGSNCGDRRQHVMDAIKWIEEVSWIEKSSSLYFSPDIKGTGHTYLNAVVVAEFDGGADEFNGLIKEYEKRAGRDAECRKRGLVPIDIDIVISDAEILRPKDYRAEYFLKGYEEIINKE